MSSLWEKIAEETVKQSSGIVLSTQLPRDSSIVAKVRNGVAASLFGVIVWEALKGANEAGTSALQAYGRLYDGVSVKDPKTGKEITFDSMDSFTQWLKSLDDQQAKKLLEEVEERRRKRRLAALDFEH